MIYGIATVDQGRKSVTVMSGDTFMGTWAPDVTTSNALEKIAMAGWRRASGATWNVSPADNGHTLTVVKDA